MQYQYKDIISKHLKGRMSSCASFYLGRGSKISDLNAEMLEGIYQGIKSDIGNDAAKSFVNMVGDMVDDASATTFLQSLERLECNGWQYQGDLVPSTGKAIANSIAETIQNTERKSGGRDAALVGESLLGLAMSSFGGNHEPSAGEGLHIIMPFLNNHKKELDKDLPKGVAKDPYRYKGYICG